MESASLAGNTRLKTIVSHIGRILILTGIGLLLLASYLSFSQQYLSRNATLSFLALAAADTPAGVEKFLATEPDQSLWSQSRIAHYQQAADATKLPLALLTIDAVKIQVPVFSSASDTELNRGAGWITATTPVHQTGNIGIAAHRDSFFRGLKDIAMGDTIVLQTLSGERVFHVSRTQIVDPWQTEVLNISDESQITLVTCYPFYYVGSAPKRFIVTATEDTLSQPR